MLNQFPITRHTSILPAQSGRVSWFVSACRTELATTNGYMHWRACVRGSIRYRHWPRLHSLNLVHCVNLIQPRVTMQIYSSDRQNASREPDPLHRIDLYVSLDSCHVGGCILSWSNAIPTSRCADRSPRMFGVMGACRTDI